MRVWLSLIPLLLLLALPAHAEQRVTTYSLTSGTGFVINTSGNIVTNNHVVRECKSISILTPKGEKEAALVANDAEMDLAVLQAAYTPFRAAPLRWNISDLEPGDTAFIIGYPGKEGAFGQEQNKKTRIISLKGPVGEEKWIQLASVAAHGNSGGPVVDGMGNVVGVVTGIAYTYKRDTDGQPVGDPVNQSDIAITMRSLRDFLREHGISFYESASGPQGYTDKTLHARVHGFIVPVRCVQNVETHIVP